MGVTNRDRFLYSFVIFLAVFTMRCTTTSHQPESTKPTEPVKTETNKVEGDQSLPPELRDAQSFDPASSLDQKAIEESDFYKAKKEAESAKIKVDEEWKAQDELDSNIRKSKEEQEKRKQEELKKEDERKEESRKRAVNEYSKYAKERAQKERKTAEMVKKMPTISEEEVNWNGLE
jgi:hypothetical protein